MRLFGRDLDKDVVVVAEVGVNHEGDVDTAVKMVKLAADAGADAVKFQTYTPSHFISTSRADSLQRVSQFHLDEEGHYRVMEAGQRHGIEVFSSAITDDVVPFLGRHFPAIKIASGDIDFEPVIRGAARQNKPLLISVGNATIDDVDAAVGWVREELKGIPLQDRLVLLQCTSSYPAPIEEANLAVIPLLKQRYGVAVGYSHHVIGAEACLAAVAVGASLLEVHFTDSKEGRTFRDHLLSMTPPELSALIESARRVRASIGSPIKEIQASERGHHLDIRKGIVAARDLQSGITISPEDLAFARPAIHFRSGQRDLLIGRRLARPVAAGAMLTKDDLG